jgi:Tol biopolymer transport system component
MKSKAARIGLCLLITLCNTCRAQNDSPGAGENSPVLNGAYFDQKSPGKTPELFAPGIVSSEHQEHSSLSFSPDGNEMWWSRWRLPHDMDKYPQVIMFISYENGSWGAPAAAPFSGKYRDGGPAYSPDGNKIYFYSRRPLKEDTDEMHDNDIWYVERTVDGWSRPVNLGNTVNSPYMEATPSLAANGNLYFTSDRIQYDDPIGSQDIFISEYIDGNFTKPRALSPAINTSYARDGFPFIALDESYIIFSRDSRKFDNEGNLINGDRKLMIAFKDKDGEWQNAFDMGSDFYNTRFPSVSPDKKYLFFTKFTPGGHEDFYWVDAGVIEDLKPKQPK